MIPHIQFSSYVVGTQESKNYRRIPGEEMRDESLPHFPEEVMMEVEDTTDMT